MCVLEALGLLDLDENEIVLLLTFAVAATGSMSQESRPPLIPIDPFIQKDDLQFQFSFRFTKEEVMRLLPCLRIPPLVSIEKFGNVDARIVVLVMLHRLHYPVTYLDMEETFGLYWYDLCRIYRYAVDYVYELFYFRILFDTVLLQINAARYAACISRKCSAALDHVIVFIDGTLKFQCRPVRGHRAIWNGHKRHHGLKFQCLTAPDGLVASTFGPCDGRRHDSTMLQLSNVVGLFRNYLPGWCMYGDGAYPLCPEIIKPYGGANVTPQQAAWNAAMSAGRISVEWGFASVSRLWAQVNFVPLQKTLQTQSGKTYLVAVVLHNMHNCCRPNQISQYFDCSPPTLEQYCGIEDVHH